MSNKEIINIKSLYVSYKDNIVINNIDFKLYENEIVSIIGESGSGKTTLARYIMGLNNDLVHYKVKEYCLDGKRIDLEPQLLEKIYGNTISMVLQDPVTSLNPTLKIGKQFKIMLKEENHKITNIEMNDKIKDIFEEINIKNYNDVLNKYPAEISGGMNQRINIALSLIKEPKILVMDEPTSAIDADNRLNLIKLIKKIKENRKLSTIFITHDIVLAQNIADRIVVMKNGKIIEENTKKKGKFKFANAFTNKLCEDSNLIKSENNKNNDNNENKIKLIEFDGVKKDFNNKIVINNINFSIFKKDTLGILGESGSGKSTICKLIMGIYKPSNGIIHKKQDIKIEMVYQNPNTAIDSKQEIFKILNENNYIMKKKVFSESEIYQYLKDFNLPINVLKMKSNELSGGQRQIISIVRALLNKPDIIILDEPTSSLDVSSQKILLDLLKDIKEKYSLTYIIVSHDNKVITYMCNRCINLNSLL